MRVSTIYALCEPETGEVRYIGKTVAPIRTRLTQHVSTASKGQRTHLHCWIRSLASRPTIKVIETVPCEEDSTAEMRVIAECRSKGFRLTNGTDGGDGCIGRSHTPETREKLRAINLGCKRSPVTPEARVRMADAQRGKRLTQERRAKIAASRAGHKVTVSLEAV